MASSLNIPASMRSGINLGPSSARVSRVACLAWFGFDILAKDDCDAVRIANAEVPNAVRSIDWFRCYGRASLLQFAVLEPNLLRTPEYAGRGNDRDDPD